MQKTTSASLFKSIKNLIQASKQQLVQEINIKIVDTYYNVGNLIIEYEQQGNNRAVYAKKTLPLLSEKLSKLFGRGYLIDNLEKYKTYLPNKNQLRLLMEPEAEYLNKA